VFVYNYILKRRPPMQSIRSSTAHSTAEHTLELSYKSPSPGAASNASIHSSWFEPTALPQVPYSSPKSQVPTAHPGSSSSLRLPPYFSEFPSQQENQQYCGGCAGKRALMVRPLSLLVNRNADPKRLPERQERKFPVRFFRSTVKIRSKI
jgi:hypothetical protein